MAIMKGHEAIVTTLLSSGVDVNAPARVDGRGYTPLLIAMQEGNEAIVKTLIQARADMERADVKGRTPLHMAALQNHRAVVMALVNAGAKVPQAIKETLRFMRFHTGSATH
jgi:ankyrin repeat protein